MSYQQPQIDFLRHDNLNFMTSLRANYFLTAARIRTGRSSSYKFDAIARTAPAPQQLQTFSV